MKHRIMGKFSIVMSLTLLLSLFAGNVQAATTLTSNSTGTHGGYNYEYWKDNGSGTMVLNDGGAFSCEWSNINNILFRKGLKYNETQTHQQIGDMSMTYACNYQPNGNSYLSVYGWTSDPLVEYYIIESWGTWKPPGNVQSKGTVTIDGGVYDIFETTRTQQPSIKGTATFQQYWSVRQQKRSSGTISVSEHFNAWEAKGMKMGKFYEISLVVEGYQSSGKADVTKMSIDIDGVSTTQATPIPTLLPVTERSAFTTIEAEEYNDLNGSTIKSIGTGVGYIENGNYLVFNKINFGSGASSFKAKVANGNTTATTIQLRLGSSSGTLIGSLQVPASGDWDAYEELSTSVSGVSGTEDLYLCFNGSVNIDSFSFGTGSSNPTTTSTPTTPGTTFLGDVDGNGTVDALDFAKFRQYLLGMISSVSAAADVNKDGSANSIDFGMLRQHLLGIINLGSTTVPTIAPTTKPTVVVTPTPTTPPTTAKFHCFLLLGQSNMAGWPKAEASDKVTNSRILSLGYDNNQWGVAVPPLHEAWQGAIGPGDWFSKTIINELPANDTIGLIPCAISGEKIETFMKNGGSKYNWILSRAKSAQEKGGVIEGILLHQGESNNGQSDWPNKVNTLISDLKKDLGLGDVPVLAGELLYSGSCAGHNTQINKLPSVVKNCYVISASGLSGDSADSWGLHFNHASQVTLGKRYAEKMIQVLGW